MHKARLIGIRLSRAMPALAGLVPMMVVGRPITAPTITGWPLPMLLESIHSRRMIRNVLIYIEPLDAKFLKGGGFPDPESNRAFFEIRQHEQNIQQFQGVDTIYETIHELRNKKLVPSAPDLSAFQ